MSGMQLEHADAASGREMILAPRMIQSMEILQLPIMALEERISQELDENPVLELREAHRRGIWPTRPGPPTSSTKKCRSRRRAGHQRRRNGRFQPPRALERDLRRPFNEDHRPSAQHPTKSDRKHDAMSNMPSRPQSLQDYLDDSSRSSNRPRRT